MKPAESIANFYGDHFGPVLAAHLLHGYVRSEPGFFFMGRSVPSTAPEVEILDFSREFAPADCDAWFVAAMAGDMAAALAAIPYPLTWLVFQRHNKSFRHYNIESLTNKIHGKSSKRSYGAAARS